MKKIPQITMVALIIVLHNVVHAFAKSTDGGENSFQREASSVSEDANKFIGDTGTWKNESEILRHGSNDYSGNETVIPRIAEARAGRGGGGGGRGGGGGGGRGGGGRGGGRWGFGGGRGGGARGGGGGGGYSSGSHRTGGSGLDLYWIVNFWLFCYFGNIINIPTGWN